MKHFIFLHFNRLNNQFVAVTQSAPIQMSVQGHRHSLFSIVYLLVAIIHYGDIRGLILILVIPTKLKIAFARTAPFIFRLAGHLDRNPTGSINVDLDPGVAIVRRHGRPPAGSSLLRKSYDISRRNSIRPVHKGCCRSEMLANTFFTLCQEIDHHVLIGRETELKRIRRRILDIFRYLIYQIRISLTQACCIAEFRQLLFHIRRNIHIRGMNELSVLLLP